ncbi:DUF805 domain-containing protein [Flavobacterium humidisoli]|uniref:DUF805 domain-containing protein n=1 Tax=Flavobacterium humidisoli TaxID=2937442 RepID=A0ABY4LU32_9FLAO|nr:DUF805 domain-containing protein [Flavobacterium humidisoli]UPZ16584.1 DUF805 domain-containing protein [Flavobacterium humidisoli]
MLKIYTNVLFANYINFKGRARRKEFWSFFFINTMFYFGLKSIVSLMDSDEDLLFEIYTIALFLPMIAVGFRRMHDINKSGWYFFIPFYNVYLCTVMGDEGQNQYGADPINELEYLKELGKNLN